MVQVFIIILLKSLSYFGNNCTSRNSSRRIIINNSISNFDFDNQFDFKKTQPMDSWIKLK